MNSGNKTLQLKVYLEGLYAGAGLMTEALDESGNPKWGTGIADKITVELHDPLNYSTIVYTAGSVNLAINGNALLGGSAGIPGNLNASYYITIKHRNSIETTSALPVSFAAGTINYSFDAPSKAFASNLKPMPGGVYAIFGGDVNQDGLVDSSDMIFVDNDVRFFATGYISTDVNGDGLIDSTDMILIDNNSKDFVGSILP